MSSVERHVFVSYCHADVEWLRRLQVHLRPLVRTVSLELWDDSRISPGQSWHDEIAKALARARVGILIVSADFLASEFIVNNELPPLLQRAARGGLLILPLVVSPCLFQEHEQLARFQCVNDPERPLSGLSRTEAEAALVSLARSVEKYFRLLDTSTVVANARVQTSLPVESRLTSDAGGAKTASPSRSLISSYGPLVVERPLNLGFDSSAPGGIPIGWFDSFGYVSGVSTDYGIRTAERTDDPAGGMCAVLEKAPPASSEFGSLMQRCPGRFLAGRTLRIEGDLRTEEVSGWAGLWLRADANDRPNVFFDNMSGRPIRGTTNWARYHIDAPLPTTTEWINFGIVLSGPGVLYADNIRVLVWSSEGTWQDV